MYRLPSTSQTCAPLPLVITGAIPSGNWSVPLAYVCAPPGITARKRWFARIEPVKSRCAPFPRALMHR